MTDNHSSFYLHPLLLNSDLGLPHLTLARMYIPNERTRYGLRGHWYGGVEPIPCDSSPSASAQTIQIDGHIGLLRLLSKVGLFSLAKLQVRHYVTQHGQR